MLEVDTASCSPTACPSQDPQHAASSLTVPWSSKGNCPHPGVFLLQVHHMFASPQSSSICVKSSPSSQHAARLAMKVIAVTKQQTPPCIRHPLNAVSAADLLSLPSFSASSHASIFPKLAAAQPSRFAVCRGFCSQSGAVLSFRDLNDRFLPGSTARGCCMIGWYLSCPHLLASDAPLSVARRH